ncbi:hypothetical protein CLU79DRAFT_760665 [Phycomyces nitens]|nr:hypothetical protein CLU79DRAFT_760665 [Phycomyces nitens]
MLSKSLIKSEHIRPYWFLAESTPAPDALTLATVMTLDEWADLVHIANLWKGPISVTLQVPTEVGLSPSAVVGRLLRIKDEYEAEAILKAHVDIHLVLRPTQENQPSLGGFQEARNMARLFSRSEFVVHVPIKTQWISDLAKTVQTYSSLLRDGDILVVPTFAFPVQDHIPQDVDWPLDKETLVDQVEEGRIGLLDYHWGLNEGPTSYEEWQGADIPYLVSDYDYHYGPVYVSTRKGHPWCEERFEDALPACIYSAYLAGADLWVLPNDYILRTGQEPENSLSGEARKIQLQLYKNYRIEQCVFYARKFDQSQEFESDRSSHIKQECTKVIGSLKKQDMISKKI